MRLNKLWIATLFAGAIGAVPVAASAYSPFEPNACAWHVVKSPNPQPNLNDLLAVTAVSATDAWAGGYYRDASNVDHSLFEHWNGTKWSIVAGPNLGYSFIYGMGAISSKDVWAVGAFYDPAHSVFQNVTLNWNGSAWKVANTPSLGYVNNFLYSVSGTSASSVFTVGTYQKTSTARGTVVASWNNAGGSWILGPGPDKGTADSAIVSVASISPKNAWAVGAYASGGHFQTLAVHWTGTKWVIVSTPDVNALDNPLNSVTAVSANDVWAIGDYYTGSAFDTLSLHWNGTAWSIVPSPNVTGASTALFSTSAINHTDVWAVGEYTKGAFAKTFTMNWNGSKWSIVPSPNVGPNDSFLNSVTRIPKTANAWAVGATSNSDPSYHQTLIEEFHC